MFSVIIFRLGAGPRLASAVGKDEQGRGLLSGEELDTSLVKNEHLNKKTTHCAGQDRCRRQDSGLHCSSGRQGRVPVGHRGHGHPRTNQPGLCENT